MADVLFLSDGKPSDKCDPRELKTHIRAALMRLDGLEQFQLLGFGEADEETLGMMAAAVPRGVATEYQLISGPSGYAGLAESVSTFASSVAASRVSSVSAVAHAKPLRRVNRSFTERMDLYPDCAIELPPREVGDFMGDMLPLRGSHDLLISRTLFGHGGERNAYLMRFARDNNFTNCDEEWVVKEGKHMYVAVARHEPAQLWTPLFATARAAARMHATGELTRRRKSSTRRHWSHRRRLTTSPNASTRRRRSSAS